MAGAKCTWTTPVHPIETPQGREVIVTAARGVSSCIRKSLEWLSSNGNRADVMEKCLTHSDLIHLGIGLNGRLVGLSDTQVNLCHG
jgi:hypothetical protein